MKTRSCLKLNSYGIKAIIGKILIGKQRFYLVEWEDESEKNLFVNVRDLQQVPYTSMIIMYDRLEKEGETNIRIDVKDVLVNYEEDTEEEDNLINDKKTDLIRRNRQKKSKILSDFDNRTVSSIPKIANGNKHNILLGRTVFEPITINEKLVTMADILKFSKYYCRFNDYRNIVISKIFGRSHGLCYNDVFDYKFFALSKNNQIIVFTKDQVDFKQFFLPMYHFMKKYPFTENEPSY